MGVISNFWQVTSGSRENILPKTIIFISWIEFSESTIGAYSVKFSHLFLFYIFVLQKVTPETRLGTPSDSESLLRSSVTEVSGAKLALGTSACFFSRRENRPERRELRKKATARKRNRFEILRYDANSQNYE